MNIAKALKEKNRITGRIAKLQGQIYKYNRYNEGKNPDFDSRDLLKSLQEEWAHLINLKTKIALANVGIAEKLIRLSEAKAELKFWTSFICCGPKEETTEDIDYNYVTKESQVKTKVVISNIPSIEVANNVERVQKLVETLQDEIDDFNATTQI